jgi:hypothetical protein
MGRQIHTMSESKLEHIPFLQIHLVMLPYLVVVCPRVLSPESSSVWYWEFCSLSPQSLIGKETRLGLGGQRGIEGLAGASIGNVLLLLHDVVISSSHMHIELLSFVRIVISMIKARPNQCMYNVY